MLGMENALVVSDKQKEMHVMQIGKRLRYGAAVLACGLYSADAMADPVSVDLFYTVFSGTPNVWEVTANLNGSSLTFKRRP